MPQKLSALRVRATVAALACSLAGGGVMYVLWRRSSWPQDVAAWPDFRAGSFGDVVLLPLIVGTTVLLGGRGPAAARRAWRPAAAAGTLGLAVGLATQYLWWSDPQPAGNWTFDGPHDFSTPGLWHACFFVVMAGAISALTSRAIWAIRAARSHGGAAADAALRSPASPVLVYAATAFSGLVVLDSAATVGTLSSIASLVALAVAGVAFVALFAWAMGGNLAWNWLRLLVATLSAGVTVIACIDWPGSSTTIAFLLATPVLLVGIDRMIIYFAGC